MSKTNQKPNRFNNQALDPFGTIRVAENTISRENAHKDAQSRKNLRK